jgi:hypothetical protein
MLGTRAARLRTAGGAVTVLAAAFTLYGVVGLAQADTTLPSVYCYKNPPGNANPERIYVTNLVRTDPDSNGLSDLNWQTQNQYWADALHAYVDPTMTLQDHTVKAVTEAQVEYAISTADIECTQLLKNDFVHGLR